MREFPQNLTVGPYRLHPIAPTPENARMIFDIFAADAHAFRFWMPDGVYASPSAVLAAYERGAPRQDMCLYGIWCGDELLGEIGYANGTSVVRRRGVLGYWLKKSARGRGIIAAVMPEILRVGFVDMDFDRVVVQCACENMAVRANTEKMGFHLDGILRHEIVWPDGTFSDECNYSILKSEWAKENKNA